MALTREERQDLIFSLAVCYGGHSPILVEATYQIEKIIETNLSFIEERAQDFEENREKYSTGLIDAAINACRSGLSGISLPDVRDAVEAERRRLLKKEAVIKPLYLTDTERWMLRAELINNGVLIDNTDEAIDGVVEIAEEALAKMFNTKIAFDLERDVFIEYNLPNSVVTDDNGNIDLPRTREAVWEAVEKALKLAETKFTVDAISCRTEEGDDIVHLSFVEFKGSSENGIKRVSLNDTMERNEIQRIFLTDNITHILADDEKVILPYYERTITEEMSITDDLEKEIELEAGRVYILFTLA